MTLILPPRPKTAICSGRLSAKSFSDFSFSSEDTDDGNRLELSSLTTSDAASERLAELDEPVEEKKVLRKKEPVIQSDKDSSS